MSIAGKRIIIAHVQFAMFEFTTDTFSKRVLLKMFCDYLKNSNIHFLSKQDSFFGRKGIKLLH